MIKQYLKRHLPQKWISWLKCKYSYIRNMPSTNRAFKFLKKQNLKYSGTFRDDKKTALSSLLVISHVLEKGITMPNRRPGFGYDRARLIINTLNNIISRYGDNSIEVQSALLDLKQYVDIHISINFLLPEDIVNGISKLLPHLRSIDGNCYSTTREEYFRQSRNIDFKEFALSRHSIRWFSEEPVEDKKLYAAIKLAQTAPSACNRQATRVKIVSSVEGKRLLCEMQNGNRGFGDKADKWLIITSELGNWSSFYPQDPYVDGGIFTMNLLYALHYYGIMACTLNAHLTEQQQRILHDTLDFPASEILVAFIVIGNPVEKFLVPKSRRLNIDDIIQKM